MTQNEFSEKLMSLIKEFTWMDEIDRDNCGLQQAAHLENAEVLSFEEGFYLTNDDGFVIRLTEGSEFQITVRRSR